MHVFESHQSKERLGEVGGGCEIDHEPAGLDVSTGCSSLIFKRNVPAENP
jgi:hypothetical protein